MAIQSSPVATKKARAHRLLLLSCSQRKLRTPGKILALERYDGPAFRVVRRYLRESQDPVLHICVLSAKYGLIAGDDQIEDYDRKMDPARAAELRESSVATLKNFLRGQRYSEVFVCTSRIYLTAVPCIEKLHLRVSFAAPGQGKMLASLRRWLRGELDEH